MVSRRSCWSGLVSEDSGSRLTSRRTPSRRFADQLAWPRPVDRELTSSIGCDSRVTNGRSAATNSACLDSLHEDPPHGDARLPAIECHAEPRGLRGHSHVRVGEHEHRVAAGQFQRRGDEPLAEPAASFRPTTSEPVKTT